MFLMALTMSGSFRKNLSLRTQLKKGKFYMKKFSIGFNFTLHISLPANALTKITKIWTLEGKICVKNIFFIFMVLVQYFNIA